MLNGAANGGFCVIHTRFFDPAGCQQRRFFISSGSHSFSRFFRAVISPFRRLFSPSVPCALCASGLPDARCLAKIIVQLPVGQRVVLPTLRVMVGGSFKALCADLDVLENQLNLPITRPHKGVLLSSSVHLCEKCAQFGESSREFAIDGRGNLSRYKNHSFGAGEQPGATAVASPRNSGTSPF